MKKKFVIVGASAAGIGAINKFVQLSAGASVLCISDEIDVPYNKCLLADYLAGAKQEHELYTRRPEFFAQHGVEFMSGTKVVLIFPELRQIELHDGRRIEYEKLFLGTGAAYISLPLVGSEAQNYFYFHRFADAKKLFNFVKTASPRRALVIGAGLSGLECADSLQRHGLQVTVVDRAPHVLARQIDEDASSFIQERMRSKQIIFYPSTQVQGFVQQDNNICTATLSTGIELSVDLVVCAVGSRAQNELAATAGIQMLEGNIITDDYLCTSHPDIYAAGDAVVVKDLLTGNFVRSCTWPDAMLQGAHAALAMHGQPKKYSGVSVITSSAFFEVKFATCGAMSSRQNVHFVVHSSNEQYHKLHIENGRLKGFLLVGNTSLLSQLRRAVLTQEPVDINTLYK